jgi:predicted metal-dependent hydrolase
MDQKLIQKSKKFYAFLLKLYPETYKREFGEEMKYVFSQSIKDAYTKNRLQGIIREWLKTVLDALKSIINEHLENFKGGNSMKINKGLAQLKH